MDQENSSNNYLVALEELKSINRIIDKVCRARETNHIMSIIIDELIRCTDASQGVISLIPINRDEDFVTVVRKHQTDSEDIPYRVSDMICGWALENKQVLRVDDLDNDERFRNLGSQKGQFKSILCSPMVVRGEVVGLTSLVRNEKKGPFGDDHARLVGIVSSQSAQILSNAMLLEELARKNELLELSQRRLHDENVRLQKEISDTFSFENIVGKTEIMKRVMTLASKISSNDSPVLVIGPTGTGKELIARAIHYNSRRRNRPFVVKNCGVKTESLLESELFGHVKGAFTGADRSKLGLFKEADGGTVFLDEIGDAPLSTQVAILRVLETGEIRPVGAGKTDFVDVRIISATNKDLKSLIDDGRFRQDLYYRLNTFTIELPPLTHRREDIPLLVHHSLRKLKVKLGLDALAISPEALEQLCRCPWPGNVRQLENELERAAIVCDSDGIINVSDLSGELRQTFVAENPAKGYHGPLKDLVEKVESDLIRSTLSETKGNILRTSKLLGLTRKGLKDKMARYQIKSDSQRTESD